VAIRVLGHSLCSATRPWWTLMSNDHSGRRGEGAERERERERPWQAAMHGARWKKQGWLKRRGEASRLSERG
jgi:hypothetical protein